MGLQRREAGDQDFLATALIFACAYNLFIVISRANYKEVIVPIRRSVNTFVSRHLRNSFYRTNGKCGVLVCYVSYRIAIEYIKGTHSMFLQNA